VIKKIIALCAVSVVALGISARAAQAPDKNIAEIAVSNPNFSTLVKALTAADLVDTLKGDGPFTVFAPTNAAFAKIKPATLNALLNNKEALKKVLLYHVVPGKVMAADVVKLKNGTKVKSAAGPTITVKVSPGVMVNNAKVTKTDIEATNGVIHVIDTVIMPGPAMKSKMAPKMHGH
jgi:transforming growth factor-beta-induced protein